MGFTYIRVQKLPEVKRRVSLEHQLPGKCGPEHSG